MADKVFISEQMIAGRIVSHGQITDLSSAFSLAGNLPFTIFAKAKDEATTSVMLNCKCYQDEVASPVPVVCGDWTPLAIVELAADSTILDSVDLYWGCGYYVEG